MGIKVGDFIKHEDDAYEEGDAQGRFVRIRVCMNVFKSILRSLMLQIGNRPKSWVNFKYNFLPLFCHLCGIIGHDIHVCPTHFQQRCTLYQGGLPYGRWLRARTTPSIPPATMAKGGSSGGHSQGINEIINAEGRRKRKGGFKGSQSNS